jgi:hypothetical protein
MARYNLLDKKKLDDKEEQALSIHTKSTSVRQSTLATGSMAPFGCFYCPMQMQLPAERNMLTGN